MEILILSGLQLHPADSFLAPRPNFTLSASLLLWRRGLNAFWKQLTDGRAS
jgi:hypothetical protein